MHEMESTPGYIYTSKGWKPRMIRIKHAMSRRQMTLGIRGSIIIIRALARSKTYLEL